MKDLPVAARLFVVPCGRGAIILGMFRRTTIANPLLFASCSAVIACLCPEGQTALATSGVDDVRVVRGGLAALLLLGANETMNRGPVTRGPSARPHGHRTAPFRTLFQHGVARAHREGGGLGVHAARAAIPAQRLFAAGRFRSRSSAPPTYFVSTRCSSRRRSRFDQAVDRARVERDFLWSAPSYFVGAGAGRESPRRDRSGRLLVASLGRPRRCI